MKKIRFSIYVLLSSLCLVHVDKAYDPEAMSQQNNQTLEQDKSTKQDQTALIVQLSHTTSSPVMKKNHGTTPVDFHRTTPVELKLSSLSKFPSYPSFDNIQKALSQTFSAEELSAFAGMLSSPKKLERNKDVRVCHGTSPIGSGNKK